ncbi:MAG: phosphotransferase [Actinomycetia bacterium]|nr:phosphotransferase [Actinomycetes bacterium]
MAVLTENGVGAELLARLDAVPQLADRCDVVVLSGGLTNQNLKVSTPAGTYVARLSTPESSLLAIDRSHEHVNSAAAAESGAAPSVVAFAPEANILVVDYIDGRTWDSADILAPANAGRIAEVCHLLHSSPAFGNDFNMLSLQRHYLTIVQERDLRLPDRYLDFTGHVSAIEDALKARPVPATPCNNDLLAANFIDTGDRVWLIDYEYSGNNDPFFEIGNIWSEASGAPDDLARLVTAYVGRTSRALTARAWLWGLMSKYGWTLWASIQDGTSDLDFDFWAWGMEKYERVIAEFDSPDFGRALEVVRHSD